MDHWSQGTILKPSMRGQFSLPLLMLATQATWSLEQTTCDNDVLLQGMLLSRPQGISLKDFYTARKHNTRFKSNYFISELLFKQTCFLQAAMWWRIFPKYSTDCGTLTLSLSEVNISSYFLVVSASFDQT